MTTTALAVVTPTRKTGQPPVEQMKGSGSSDAGTLKQMQAEQPRDCGAMSQQGSFSYHGNVLRRCKSWCIWGAAATPRPASNPGPGRRKEMIRDQQQGLIRSKR